MQVAKPQINKGAVNRQSSVIPSPGEVHQGLVSFSFKYLELEHEKFCLPDTTTKTDYFAVFCEKIQSICTMKCQEFRQAGKTLRSHNINWWRTTEPTGFAHLPQQLQDFEAWQLSLRREDLGRVHGFFIGDVFFVVWIDHEHKLYP